MFDLNKITPVLDHLKQVASPNMYRVISQREIMIHCPFCDDALRKKAASHGHLYISTEAPVFHCFRCSSSGTLMTLLIETGFDDREVLDYLSSFIKISFTKDYFKMRNRKALALRFSQLKRALFEYTKEFKNQYQNEYIKFKQYIDNRIGENIESSNFLITPYMYNNKLICRFTNYSGENVLIRYIDDYQNQKYIINKNIINNMYYFQDISNNNNIVICEGPFDIINLYLYNDLFVNNIFISINGKNYVNSIERIVLMYYLTQDLSINIVFDEDYVSKSYKLLKNLKKLVSVYSGKIQVSGYKPLIGRDVGEFPAVVKIE